jgi:hypothetical protein
MRRVTMVRLGVAAALATMGIAGAIGSGCSNSTAVATPDGGQTAGNNDGGQTGSGPDGSTGSTDGATGASETGAKDSGTFDSALPTPANVIVANTAPGVPPFRLCLATGSGATLAVTQVSPLPDGPGAPLNFPQTGTYPTVPPGTPGIYPGTIGAFPTVTDLSQITLTPFLVLASSVANDINLDGGAGSNGDGGAEEDCVSLIGTHGLGTAETAAGATKGRLVAGTDFFPLPPIPTGTLQDAKTFLLTVNGCLPGGTPGAQLNPAVPPQYTCGADYDGGNSVNVGYVQLDTSTAVADGGIGLQFAHRSTAIENTTIAVTGVGVIHPAATDGVLPVLLQPGTETVPNDGGLDEAGNPIDAGTTTVPITVPSFLSVTPVKYSDNGVTTLTSVPFTTTDPTTSFFGAAVVPLDGGQPSFGAWPSPGDLIALPLASIDQLSAWNASTSSAPTGFQVGQSYTLILVGDPVAQQLPNPDGGPPPNPLYDGRGIHIVAFPNVYAAKKL